jgi:hypothetical protein
MTVKQLVVLLKTLPEEWEVTNNPTLTRDGQQVAFIELTDGTIHFLYDGEL